MRVAVSMAAQPPAAAWPGFAQQPPFPAKILGK
jgi:hypothetical protein